MSDNVVVIENLAELDAAGQAYVRALLQPETPAGVHLLAAGPPGYRGGFGAIATPAGGQPGLFNLAAGGRLTRLQAASATCAEIKAVIARLRAGRHDRRWALEEITPARSRLAWLWES